MKSWMGNPFLKKNIKFVMQSLVRRILLISLLTFETAEYAQAGSEWQMRLGVQISARKVK